MEDRLSGMNVETSSIHESIEVSKADTKSETTSLGAPKYSSSSSMSVPVENYTKHHRSRTQSS